MNIPHKIKEKVGCVAGRHQNSRTTSSHNRTKRARESGENNYIADILFLVRLSLNDSL